MAYCQTSDVTAYLSITSSTDNTLIGNLVTRAQKYLEEQIGRVFEASVDGTRYFDAVRDLDADDLGWATLLVLDRDLCSITTVTNGDGVVISSADYVTEPRNNTPYWGIRLKRSASASWTYSDTPENAISITGKWAYSTTAPDDIKQATIELAAYLYRRRGQEPTAIDSPQVSPSGVMLYPAELPAYVKSVIAHYQPRGAR